MFKEVILHIYRMIFTFTIIKSYLTSYLKLGLVKNWCSPKFGVNGSEILQLSNLRLFLAIMSLDIGWERSHKYLGTFHWFCAYLYAFLAFITGVDQFGGWAKIKKKLNTPMAVATPSALSMLFCPSFYSLWRLASRMLTSFNGLGS